MNMKAKEQFIEELVKLLQKKYEGKYEVSYTSDDDRILFAYRENGITETNSCSGESVYAAYKSGKDMKKVFDEIAAFFASRNNDALEITKKISSYDAVKDYLIIRAIAYTDELKDADVVFRKIGDIALTLYAGSYRNEKLTSFKVPKTTALGWRIDLFAVFYEALKNTAKLFPPRVFFMDKLAFNKEYKGEAFMAQESAFSHYRENIISNPMKLNGAVTIFLPGVAKRISELIGGDFYFVTTSIHEAVVHSLDSIDPKMLSSHICEMTQFYLERGMLQPREVLSRSVFKYNSAKDTIEVAVMYLGK